MQKSKYDAYDEYILQLMGEGYTFKDIVNKLRMKGVPHPDASSISQHIRVRYPKFKKPKAKKKEEIEKGENLCDDRCRTCKYCTRLSGVGESILACMYIVEEGKLKDSGAGVNCKYYKKGRYVPKVKWNRPPDYAFLRKYGL